MIKKIYILLLMASAHTAASQTKVAEIVAPSSPAASVIGLQPTEILAPKSAKALETALYSNFVSNNALKIPNDFALEFMPYWAADHGLSAREYLYPSIQNQIIRNSAFSIASTQNFSLGDSTPTNALGFGYRTSIFFPSKTDIKKVDNFLKKDEKHNTLRTHMAIAIESLDSATTTKAKMLDIAEKELIKQLKTIFAISEAEAKKIAKRVVSKMKLQKFDDERPYLFRNDLYNEIAAQSPGSKILTNFKEYLKSREGLRIDFALAKMVNFPTNQFEYSFAPRTSLWITPTYKFTKGPGFLKLLGVYRRDWYDTDYFGKFFPGTTHYQTNTDIGGGVALEFKKFTLQGEAVHRKSYSEIVAGTDSQGTTLYKKEEASSFQYVGTFSYRFSDQIVLSYNLGTKFNFIQTGNTLISLLSLNLGFGDPGDDIND